jgi:hypothetical protein
MRTPPLRLTTTGLGELIFQASRIEVTATLVRRNRFIGLL